MSITSKKSLTGIAFISPFLIGFILFVLWPMAESIRFSLGSVEISPTGYKIIWAGLQNFKRVWMTDVYTRTDLLNSVVRAVAEVPPIVIFSFFAATLINTKFVGRGFVRSVLFLPVITVSGIILSMEMGDVMLSAMSRGVEEISQAPGTVGRLFDIEALLANTPMPQFLVEFIKTAVDNIYNIVVSSGVQILVFLAGYQSIPPNLFEAANVEGATGWEKFWKITFPMISPLILVCLIYSVIESMASPSNSMIGRIQWYTYSQVEVAFASAMAWSYFIVLGAVIALITWFVSKKIAYTD